MCTPFFTGSETKETRSLGEAEHAYKQGDAERGDQLGGIDGDNARASGGTAVPLRRYGSGDPIAKLGLFATKDLGKGTGVGKLKNPASNPYYASLAIEQEQTQRAAGAAPSSTGVTLKPQSKNPYMLKVG